MKLLVTLLETKTHTNIPLQQRIITKILENYHGNGSPTRLGFSVQTVNVIVLKALSAMFEVLNFNARSSSSKDLLDFL